MLLDGRLRGLILFSTGHFRILSQQLAKFIEPLLHFWHAGQLLLQP